MLVASYALHRSCSKYNKDGFPDCDTVLKFTTMLSTNHAITELRSVAPLTQFLARAREAAHVVSVAGGALMGTGIVLRASTRGRMEG